MKRQGCAGLLQTTSIVTVTLCGCAAVTPRIAENVARAVAHYCAEPPEARAVYRDAVAALTAPNAIRVTCAADEAAPEPAAP